MNPLDDLRDIHLPPPPGIWPPAPGWWILLALALTAMIVLTWLLYRRHRGRAYRRIAIAKVEKLLSADGFQWTELVQLVRQTALTTLPSTPLGSSPGPDLLLSIDSVNQGTLSTALGLQEESRRRTLESWLYRDTSANLTADQRRALSREICQWIKKHRREDIC